MMSVLCCLAHDVMTCFKTPDLLQNGGSSVESPAWPRRGMLRVVMPGNIQTSLSLRDQDEGMGWANKTAVTSFTHVAADAL